MWAGLYFFSPSCWALMARSGCARLALASDSSSLTGFDRTGLTRRIMQDELALRLTRWSRSGRLP